MMCENIFLRSLFLFVAYSQLLCGLLSKCLLVSELYNVTSLDKYFFDYSFQRLNLGWQFKSCVAVCSRSSWA